MLSKIAPMSVHRIKATDLSQSMHEIVTDSKAAIILLHVHNADRLYIDSALGLVIAAPGIQPSSSALPAAPSASGEIAIRDWVPKDPPKWPRADLNLPTQVHVCYASSGSCRNIDTLGKPVNGRPQELLHFHHLEQEGRPVLNHRLSRYGLEMYPVLPTKMSVWSKEQ
jgi:hypothetical protein